MCILYPHLENILAQHFELSSFYISIGGILFDVIFLSIALNKKISFLHHKYEQQKELIIIQSSFSNIGKTLANISHQYKTPLAHLSLLTTSLEAYIHKTNNQDQLLKGITSNMRKSISFMNETMDNFNNFYKNSKIKENIIIEDQVGYITTMLQERIKLLDVGVEIKIEKDLTYYGYKNPLDNVLVVLFENALDIFEKRNIKDPTIKIDVEKKENQIVFMIKDNGGGIKITPIEDIFKTFISTKSKSSGLGLAMCKILVENKLKGKILAYNNENGAIFKIMLNIN